MSIPMTYYHMSSARPLVRPPPLFKISQKQNNFQVRLVIATGWIVGLGEGIIVMYFFPDVMASTIDLLSCIWKTSKIRHLPANFWHQQMKDIKLHNNDSGQTQLQHSHHRNYLHSDYILNNKNRPCFAAWLIRIYFVVHIFSRIILVTNSLLITVVSEMSVYYTHVWNVIG